MQVGNSKKYSDVTKRLLLGKQVTQDEYDEAIKEQDEVIEKAQETFESFHSGMQSIKKSQEISMMKSISIARKENKKKLSPLGAPKEEPKEGQKQ